jgi:ubiquinone/menaquinone biosynthesis C-methylase UbiE
MALKTLLPFLECPHRCGPLSWSAAKLECERGHIFPIADGVTPILLTEDLADSRTIRETLSWAKHPTAEVHSKERIHPHVQKSIAETNGRLYLGAIDRLSRYPIPQLRLPESNGHLLDIGCNWGRWCVAAEMKGYKAVGIDPNIHALRAARAVSAELGVFPNFVCADARRLPFAAQSFDVVFSYSVIQHFSKDDARSILHEISRVLRPGGKSLIQMANKFGPVSFVHQARRQFGEGSSFDVRYWSPSELQRTFDQHIGPSIVSVDGFFGLGIQPTDIDIVSPLGRLVIKSSEFLRKTGRFKQFADSLYITSVKSS